MEAQIKDIMTKTLIAVPIGSPVAVAANIMKQNKIRHLPIVDEMDIIIGIISKRDFTLLENLEDIPVERVMSAPIYYIDQDTPLRSAIFKMLEHKISSLLISDENDEAIGIIIIFLFYNTACWGTGRWWSDCSSSGSEIKGDGLLRDV